MKRVKVVTTAVLAIPHVVFFPNTAIPLYVSDPKHIQMINECLSTNTPLAISRVPNPNAHFQRISLVCSMGTPILLEISDDGVYKVLLKGISRIKLQNVIQNLPYPKYSAEVINDLSSPLEESITDQKMEKLKNLFHSWVSENIVDSIERETFLQDLETINQYVDYISMYMIKDSELKQFLLENQSLFERIQMIYSLFEGSSSSQINEAVSSAIKKFEELERDQLKMAH